MSLIDYAVAGKEWEQDQRRIQVNLKEKEEEGTPVISLSELIKLKKKSVEKILAKINAKLILTANENIERLAFTKSELGLTFENELENPYLIEALEKSGYVVKFEYEPTVLILEGW